MRRKSKQTARRERARDRMLEKAKEYTLGTYVSKFVAPEFQRLNGTRSGD